ncbi:MAG: PAS domain S-box protein [Acidimicrobiales bacterium]|nr:PAS domain S-box protein [Hyphomonadaceae bacterium]RZV44913.1 MAG: PAS domain S-box protein [Acidimicrobiales bacterium]
MTQGQTPYQKMMAPASGGVPVHHAVQNAPRPPAPPRPQATPARQNPPTEEKNKLKGLIKGWPKKKPSTGSTDEAFDTDTGRRMAAIAIGFLIFYVLLMWAILQNQKNNSQEFLINDITERSSIIANNISNVFSNLEVSIDAGLTEGNTPSQAARLIAKSPNVDAAVILNSQLKVVASYPSNPGFLTTISFDDVKSDMMNIQSSVTSEKDVTTVAIKRAGNFYAVAALANGSVNVQDIEAFRSVVTTRSGQVIAGGPHFGLNGVVDGLNINSNQFNQLIANGTQSSVRMKMEGQNRFVSSTQVPNSDLFFLKSTPIDNANFARQNLTLFLLLFLGIIALVGLMLNAIYKKIRSLEEVHKKSEVSQQRFRAAIEGDKGGVWEIDLANNTAYVSMSLASLLGLQRSELQMPMDQFLGLFHPQDRERFLASARRAHMQGEFDFDMNVAHLPLILQCRGRPLTRAGSEQQRVIVGVALDITEQRGAQARLVATEARLQGALSSMTDSFVIWDAMKRLVVWNSRFENFFGLQPGQLQPGLDQASVEYMIRAAIAEVIETNNNNGAVEIKLKDGRWIRYIETPTAEGGNVSVGTNITEIRSREAELRENEKALQNTVGILKKSQEGIFELAQRYEEEKIRAEDANQSKSDFLANMSHELRTPLNAINGFSDIMQKEMFGPLGDPRYKEYINDILFSGQHLLALINDILDMSKIEAGKMTLNTEVMFMHEMIAQVVRIIRGRAEESQLKLNIYANEVQEIEADPRAVKQVLINLLTNAIKFTPENGTVQVELIPKKTGLIVKVSDSGIGISQENIERLAKPFEQVVDQSTKHKEGTGLGLALSKSLVELHGGNFKIESELGHGTTVIFSLPNRPIERKEEPKDSQVTQEISRLANDIATVLADNENQYSQDTAPESQPQPQPQPQNEPTPYPYAQPEPVVGQATQETAEPVPYPSSTGRPAA